MISLGAGPDGGGLVAGLASGRGGNVTACFASRRRTVMAAGATRDHRHIGMELGRRPTGVALVAGRAVGSRRNVTGGLAGGAAAVVAT